MRLPIILAMLFAGAIASALAVPSIYAQDEPAAEPRPAANQIVQLRWLSPRNVYDIFYKDWGVTIRYSQELNVVAISGSPEDVETVAQQIARLDNPARRSEIVKTDIEVLAYIVGGLDEGAGDESFPATLANTIDEFRDVFPYSGYRLMETVQTRIDASGKAETSGQLQSNNAHAPSAPYSLRFELKAAGPDEIVFSGLRFGLRWPTTTDEEKGQFRYQDIGINTAARLTPGETTVIGKSSTLGPIGGVFLILRARPAP